MRPEFETRKASLTRQLAGVQGEVARLKVRERKLSTRLAELGEVEAAYAQALAHKARTVQERAVPEVELLCATAERIGELDARIEALGEAIETGRAASNALEQLDTSLARGAASEGTLAWGLVGVLVKIEEDAAVEEASQLPKTRAALRAFQRALFNVDIPESVDTQLPMLELVPESFIGCVLGDLGWLDEVN